MRGISLCVSFFVALGIASRATDAEILARDIMGCREPEIFVDALKAIRDSAMGGATFSEMQARVAAERNKWLISGKCTWLTRGLPVVIEARLDWAPGAQLIEVLPVGTTVSYWTADTALTPWD